MQRSATLIVSLGILLCGLCVCSTTLQAQASSKDSTAKQPPTVQPVFLPGYALNGADTIRCKLAFDHPFPYPEWAWEITLDLAGEIMTFDANDGLIIGFGVEDRGQLFEYGLIWDDTTGPTKAGRFAKKLVAGSIDLYEYEVSFGMASYPTNGPTKTIRQINAPVNSTPQAQIPSGMYKSGSQTGSKKNKQPYTPSSTGKMYSIGKYNPHASSFISPTKLKALRKEYLAPFIADYPELLADVPKKFDRKELVRIVQEYNYWKGKQRMKAK